MKTRILLVAFTWFGSFGVAHAWPDPLPPVQIPRPLPNPQPLPNPLPPPLPMPAPVPHL